MEKKIWKELTEWLRVILFAAVAALFISNVIVSNAKVPTGSMEETIMPETV